VPIVLCPACGEDEELRGERQPDGRLLLTCERCGASWDRDTAPSCGVCGSDDVEGVPTSTLQERGRGDQWAPSGVRLVYYCWACRSNDVTATEPLPGPQPPPGGTRDLRGLRERGG
jgi:hypothetical protein